MQDKAKIMLLSLIDKRHIYLFSSLDEAMKQLANLFKYKSFLVPDQCCPNSYKLVDSYNEVRTSYGIIELKDFMGKCQNKILVVNGMSYNFAEQPIHLFMDVCKEKNCLIVNDVSSTLNMSSSRLGDYSIGSFDKESLANLGYGAFIGSNAELKSAENFDKSRLNELYEKLMEIDSRVKYLSWLNSKVKSDLMSFDIVHRSRRSFNLMVKFDSLIEKRKLVDYCEKNQLPYEIAPKYLKSNPNILAIEITKK